MLNLMRCGAICVGGGSRTPADQAEACALPVELGTLRSFRSMSELHPLVAVAFRKGCHL